MTRKPGRSAAAALLGVPLAARLFVGVSLEYTQSGCASWMCPLIGFIFAAPLWISFQFICASESDSWHGVIRKCVPAILADAFGAVLFLLLAFDISYVLRLLANTANITALNSISTPFLVLPAAAAAAVTSILGTDAAGRSARVWAHILPLPLAVMIVCQFREYEPAWLTPILGNGLYPLIENGLECAGIIALFSVIGAISVPDRGGKPLLISVFVASAAASVFAVLFQMLAPARTELSLSRASRLLMILSNGRVALILQIVMIVLWYGCLLHVAAAEASTASCMLEERFARAPAPAIAALFALACGILACTDIIESDVLRDLAKYRFPIIGGGAFVLLTIVFFVRRRRFECGTSR